MEVDDLGMDWFASICSYSLDVLNWDIISFIFFILFVIHEENKIPLIIIGPIKLKIQLFLVYYAIFLFLIFTFKSFYFLYDYTFLNCYC